VHGSVNRYIRALPASIAKEKEMTEVHGRSTRHDFDFWIGRWRQRNWRLRERLAGCEDWDEYDSTSVAWSMLDGLGNVDEFRTDWGGGYVGMSVRLFDSESASWSIYWADSRFPGPLEQPVVGSFADGIGIFECCDTFKDQPILVRFTWEVGSPTVRWQQAFSTDDGVSWETNHITESTRIVDY
jgi:hypothetical protein